MPNVDLYVLVENINLTNPQRNILVTAVQLLGQGYMYPAPIRLDSQAGIYEAKFRSGDILHFGWRTRLGSLFNVDPLTIDAYESPTSYGGGYSTEFIFSRLGIDYFRVVLFGTIAATKEKSRRECAAYLAANTGLW